MPMTLVEAYNVAMERKAAATGRRIADLEAEAGPDAIHSAPVIADLDVVRRMVVGLEVDTDELRETVVVLLNIVGQRITGGEPAEFVIDDALETAVVIGLVKGRHDAAEEARRG